jgi:NodT family efflux transporter outer membrane factor (OMF) lipoprotein
MPNAKLLRPLPILAALLAGCMVGPDYHRPHPWMPGKYINPSAPPSAETSVTLAEPVQIIQWWHTFDDPTLDSLVRRAVEQNLDLRQATSRLRQARASLGITASALFPQIGGTGAYTQSGAGAHGPAGANVDLYEAGFDAAWELDVFGGVRRDIESGAATVQAAVEDRRDVLVTLVSEVAVDYIQLRSFQRRVDIAEKNLISERRTAEVTKRRFDTGFVPKLDVDNAVGQAASTEADIPPLETAAQQEIYALAILLDRPPSALLDELGSEAPIPVTPPRIPIGLPSELLRRRPDIRRAEAQLHAATAQIGVAVADFFPQFSFTGDFDFETNKPRLITNWTSSVWSFGPSVSWPIFTAGRLEANVELQKALTEQAMLTYRQTVLTAIQDVENALIAYSKEQERRAALTQSVIAYRQALQLSTLLYSQGQTNFLNVLDAERSLFGEEDALAQSEANVAADLAALYKALGGGWQINPLATEVIPKAAGAAQPSLSRTLINQAAHKPAVTQPTTP